MAAATSLVEAMEQEVREEVTAAVAARRREEEEEESDDDVPEDVREHVGETGRHFKFVSKRHIACITLLAASLILLENDDMR